MADPLIHINYSFEDIQRYLQGKMTPAEMHAMEKAALQDPFLADAIEGFAETNSSVAKRHLNEIAESVLGERNKSRIIPFGRKFSWTRIAALVIVLAGVGLIGYYFVNTSNQGQNVAQVKKGETPNAALPVLRDSQQNKTKAETLQVNEEKNDVARGSSKEQDKVKSKMKPVTNGITADSENEMANQQAQADNMEVAPGVTDEIQKDKEANNSSINLSANNQTDSLQNLEGVAPGLVASPVIISGKVLDQNGQPIPGVVVQSADKKETVLSNSDGDFSLHKQDSLADISASAIGFQDENARLKAGGENLIVLHLNNRSLSEVVVTALGARKGDISDSTGAAPVGGWQNFNRYVQKQLNQDTTAAYFNYDDNDLVELEFSVDKAGNAVNIKFLQSLDSQRNARAVDILKRGPKWISTENKKGRVRISF